MNIYEIAENIDKSSGYNADIDKIAKEEFGLDLNGEYSDRFIMVPYESWLCTDTHVGGFLLFLDDMFVGCSWQDARKSDTEYFWKSKETYTQVREFLIELMPYDSEYFQLIIEEDLGEGYEVGYSRPELIGMELIVKSTGERVKALKIYKEVGKWSEIKVQAISGEERLIDIRDLLIPYIV